VAPKAFVRSWDLWYHIHNSRWVWLKSGLESAGFRVITAQDSPTGLDLARRESPARILLAISSQEKIRW
jgi:hypothetical protein